MWNFNLQLITIIIIIITSLSLIINSLQLQSFKTCLEESDFKIENLIVRSNTEKYKQLNGDQWNLINGKIYPAGYLLPRDSRDVQVVIICARKCNIRIVPKSGGHGYTKYAYGDSNSVILDLQSLNTVSIDKLNRIGLVGPGVRVGQLVDGLWNQGKFVTPHGICPQVGISGLALGGGFGFLARLHGLTSDNIIEMEFVDAFGDLKVLNSKNYSDLFWALRGGSSGSFGIVTSFKFKLHMAPTVAYAEMHYSDFSSFPLVFSIWNTFFNTHPPTNFNSHFYVINNTLILHFIDAQDDSAASKFGINRLQTILSRFPTPNKVSIELLNYSEFVIKTIVDTQSVPPNVKVTTLSEAALSKWPKIYFQAHSFFIQKSLNETDISGLYHLLTKVVNIFPIQFRIYALGGALNQLNPTDTAFLHRGPKTKYLCEIHGLNTNANWKGFKKMRNFFKASISLLHHKESYQNYIDAGLKNYLERYYGVNLERLIKIKNKYDPDNYFYNPQSIPLELKP